jgi:hypothetical protein
MIWHPLLLSILVLDTVGLLLILAASVNAGRIVLGWAPGSTSAKQIQLEREAESAYIKTAASSVLILFSTLVLIIGITLVLPNIIPGAMCGTGVLRATRGFGARALTFRFLCLTLFFVWLLVERLNRTRPEAPLTAAIARLVLFVLPVATLAFADTFRMISGLNVYKPVACCAVVYDQFRSLTEARSLAGVPDSIWVWGFGATSAAMLGLGLWTWRSASKLGRRIPMILAILAVFWGAEASVTLVRVLAAYHYRVLSHHCPWCLFLPEHKWVGFPLFAAVAAGMLEGLGAMIAKEVSTRFPSLAKDAVLRCQKAGLHLAASVLFFGIIAGLPAIIWRLRFGVWMR